MQRITPVPGLLARAAGKLYSLAIGAPVRDQTESAAELRLTLAHRLRPGALCHIANVEDHLPLLRSLRRKQPRWVATVHFPPEHWHAGDIAALGRLGHVITLCERDRIFFAERLGADSVSTLLHGVDCDFFRPEDSRRAPSPRLLFIGKWLRDFETAGQVFAAALERWPALEIDVVVARRWAEGSSLAALAGHPRVHWRERVPDEDLRRLYQRAWLLVMPLKETGANNALVEALASGTVPVVNRIGGVPDYGGDTVYPTCETGNTEAFLARIARWLESPEELQAHQPRGPRVCPPAFGLGAHSSPTRRALPRAFVAIREMNVASFTVIVPTFRRPATLARCLAALRDAPDIVVTDDAADPATRDLLERDFPKVRWTVAPGHGPAANRNHGAKAARGEWLAFVDDDCEPQSGWLEALARAAGEADVVEGRTVAPGAHDSPFEELVENENGGVLWSCNLAVRREVFERLGGFDEDFREAGGEDMEFAWRVTRAGWRVRFAPDALVHHPPRRIGWRGLWRRTWMIRWMSLYRLKTDQARSWPAAIIDEVILLLRITVQLLTRPDARWPRRQWFNVAWRWLTFPVVLPWILYWDRRFRTR